jgi:GAF domain-containing protein
MPDRLDHPDRLAALRRLALLDSPEEPAFDRLTRLAATFLRAPIALVSLIDSDRQFFKSAFGLPEPWRSLRHQTPLSYSFCRHVVASGRPLVIVDTREHPLTRDNHVAVALGLIAYLGIPLITTGGYTLGRCACSIPSLEAGARPRSKS